MGRGRGGVGWWAWREGWGLTRGDFISFHFISGLIDGGRLSYCSGYQRVCRFAC